jgi:hypothetical protein
MEDALIIGGIVLAYLLLRKGSISATVTTPGTPGDYVPTSSSGGPLVSGGYQVTSQATQLGIGAFSYGTGLPSYLAPPPVSAPPPPYYGGTGGTVGTGGTGLGGPVVAGVSTGTGTTARQIKVVARDPAVQAARAAGLQVTGSRMQVVVG